MPNVLRLNSAIRRINQHLLAIGVPTKEAKRFADRVCTWARDSGPEWTVTRLKSLKPAMIEMLVSKEPYKVPIGWASRKNRKGQVIFKDPLLHSIFSKAHSNITVATSFLRLYQAIELKTLSPVQVDKMVKAIESPPMVSIESLLEVISNFKVRPINSKGLKSLKRIELDSDTLIDKIGGTKSAPFFEVGHGESWTYRGSRTRKESECFAFERLYSHDKALNSLWKRFPSEVSRRWLGNDSYPFFEVDGLATLDVPCGTLVALQEGGCKVRWIANPILSIQILGEPLKDKLFAYSQMTYPEIYTDDQDAGRQKVSQWLIEGRTTYCYDCTSFTDRFPLKLQEFVLEQLHSLGIANDFDMAAFRLVMDKAWFSPHLKRTVKWAVGQPLGYNPSFHLATVSHAVVLDNLDIGRTGLWCVVGDDVVIADHTLARSYQDFMTNIAGVEINASKSVISPEMGEFLGKLITSRGVIPSIKIKPFSHQDQIVQAIAFYGSEGLKVLNRKQRELALLCYLPPYLGGLGLRPPSMSNADYIAKLNTSRIAKTAIEDELSTFYGRVPQGASLEIMNFISLKGEILSSNTRTLDLLGIAEIQQHLGQEINLNVMTCLPTCTTRDYSHGAVPKKPGWVELCDEAWRLYGANNPTDHTFPNPLNGLGYVPRSELPPAYAGGSLPIVTSTERKSHDSQFQSSYRKYFRNWKEFLKELPTAEGARVPTGEFQNSFKGTIEAKG